MSTTKKSINSDDKTIVAVITPPGEGGVAALRLSGPDSLKLLNSHFISRSKKKLKKFPPFYMRYGYFVKLSNNIIDEVMAVYMPHGKSYTGLEQVEIFCHGGQKVVELIQDELVKSGARVAEPGEFTKLAFLNGRIDLTKAESVAEIIAANTDSSFKTAREHMLGAYSEHVNMLRESLIDITAEVEASIDYPEEDIDPAEKSALLNKLDSLFVKVKNLTETYIGGKIINEGFKIAIAGRPNAGKSSLFNLLLRQQRALVTSTPGTTRDYLSEWIDLDGFKVNIIDTAGLREKGSKIEKAGQSSAKKIIDSSDLVLWMIDLTSKSWQDSLKADLISLKKSHNILIGNKIDTIRSLNKTKIANNKFKYYLISCKTQKGITALKSEIVTQIKEKMPDLTSGIVVTSARHKQKLQSTIKYLKSSRVKLVNNESPELTALDLRSAINEIDEITGKIYNDDILGRIFSKFCIGK
jgi:tRNA modification GTPase